MIDAATQKLVVLVVEDEPSALEASQIFLTQSGYIVFGANDAESARERASLHRPDVLVCDWRLGTGPDGVEVARELQQKYSLAVIFVTAYPLDELRDATEDIDVMSYMRKPVSLGRLSEVIATINP